MNTEALILFLILLLGLLLCSFLGGNCGTEGFGNPGEKRQNNYTGRQNNYTGNLNTKTNGASTSSNVNYDNYNHYSGSSTELANGTTYYGPNGGSVVVVGNSDGTQSLNVTLASGEEMMTFTPQQSTTTTTDASASSVESYTNYYGARGTASVYYGPNNSTASVIHTNNGQQAIRVKTANGTYTFTQSGSYYNPNNNTNTNPTSTQYYGSTGYNVQTYNGAYGGEAATATGPYGNTAYYAEGPQGNAVAGTTTNNPYYNPYYGPNDVDAAAITGPHGNTAYYAEGPHGNAVAGTTATDTYYNSLPPGIPRSQIPPGQEDLYILKSQVVPPVCPVCPSAAAAASSPDEQKCPPCPACARCPEPSFECKKVPNYNAINDNYLPTPVLNDFSTFGM